MRDAFHMGILKRLRDRAYGAYVIYHLYRLTTTENTDVWDQSVDTLAKAGLPVVPALVDALRYSSSASMRQGAAEALGDIASQNPGNARIVGIAPALVEAMKDEAPGVRQWIAWALCTIALENPKNAESGNIVHVVIDAMKGWDSAVRLGAAYLLGEIAQTAPETFHEVVSVLIEALNDGDKIVRGEASWALSKIIRGNSEIEGLTLIEQKLKGGAALLAKGSTPKDDVRDAMINIAGLINEVAAKKNELARNAMKGGGLMLAGEKPKPPRNGGMYREIGAIKGAVRHG